MTQAAIPLKLLSFNVLIIIMCAIKYVCKLEFTPVTSSVCSVKEAKGMNGRR